MACAIVYTLLNDECGSTKLAAKLSPPAQERLELHSEHEHVNYSHNWSENQYSRAKSTVQVR